MLARKRAVNGSKWISKLDPSSTGRTMGQCGTGIGASPAAAVGARGEVLGAATSRGLGGVCGCSCAARLRGGRGSYNQ